MKKYLVQLGLLVAAATIVLGSFHIYSRIEAHNQLDTQLIELVKRLQSQVKP